MNYSTNTHSIPNDNVLNIRLYVLDPLSVIIKLAIIGNKPIGTKIRIYNNVIYLQEPGFFQSFCRYFLNSNKTDIQFLYNPIELACVNYLNENSIKQNPKIKELFKCAQNGILKLIETYKVCSVMRICLNHYISLINNYLDETHINLFKNDDMTHYYTNDIQTKLYKLWTPEKIKIILNITTFLSQDDSAETNVKSLETIMDGIDRQVYTILS